MSCVPVLRTALRLALLASGALAAHAAPQQPNVLIVLADDLGYGDVHALNPASNIPTPHLDRLAAEGMSFRDAHSPSAVCTPTRYGLLTGRYCWRTRLKSGVLNGYGEPLLEPGRATIASVLRDQGYRTGMVGKWHLGLGFAGEGQELDYAQPIADGPLQHGFEHAFCIPASLDFPPYVYVAGDRVTAPGVVHQEASKFPAFLRAGPRAPDLDPTDCLDRLLRDAIEFVQRAGDDERPFFLYFALTAPHKPVLPHPRFRGLSGLGDYGDFVAQVDWAVGELLAALERSGQAENTLVVFTSDNGSFMHSRVDGPDHVDDPGVQAYRADRHRANGALRGTKADVWEGGHRVPFFVRWPGVVEAGSVNDRTICHVDLPATCAEIVGAELPDDAAEDSFSLLPLLRGDEATFERAPVVNHSVNGTFALRDGRWKLVAGDGSGGREAPKGKPFQQPYALFDLEADLGERKDLAAERPELVEQLSARLEELRASGRSR